MSMHGKSIAITRGPEDAAEFISIVESRGGLAHPLPTIRLTGRSNTISKDYLQVSTDYDPDHIVFMSSRAVALLFDDASNLGVAEKVRLATMAANVISVGPKTTHMLNKYGIRVNAAPKSTYSSVGIGEVFSSIDRELNRVLVPRSGASTPFLKELLNKIGFDVREIYLYDVQPHEGGQVWHDFAAMLRDGKIDGMVFTSASSVRAFFDIMGRVAKYDVKGRLNATHVVSIGPFTAAELNNESIKHHTSPVHTVAGALESLEKII